MKKSKIRNINYLEFFKKNKEFLNHIIIDVLFYSYISIFFAIFSFIAYSYQLEFKTVATIWTTGFVIIFGLKLKKDFK